MIHQTAIISPNAKIGNNVKIGPFSIISDDVEIGDNTLIYNNVVLENGARIGKDCKLFPFSVISTDPQDLKYNGEPTFAYIGDRTVVREYATINRGTTATGKTTVGSDTLIMAYSHVAHDCEIGNNVVISNSTQLAGHVVIGDWVIIGGVVKVTQFTHVGKHSFLGADCKITKDVAPFTLIGREPAQVEGINKVGLKRRGFTTEDIDEIQDFYDLLIFSGLNNSDGIEKFRKSRDVVSENVEYCINFIKNSKKGILR